MARRRTGWWAPTLLVATGILLGWVIYRQLAAAPSALVLDDSTAGTAVTVPDLPPDPEFAMLPIETFEGIVERPIFSPTRTPPSPESAPAMTAAAVEVNFKLKGIIIDDDNPVALIRPEGAPKNLRLPIGGRVGGWTIVAIDPDRVRFERDGQEKIVEPSFDAPSPADRRKLTRRQKLEERRKQRQQQQEQQFEQLQQLQDELQGQLEPDQLEQLEELLQNQVRQSAGQE